MQTPGQALQAAVRGRQNHPGAAEARPVLGHRTGAAWGHRDHGDIESCRYGVESLTCAAAAGVGWGRVLVDLVALLTKCQVFLSAKQTYNS